AIKTADADFGYSSVVGVDDEMRPLWFAEAPPPDEVLTSLLRGRVVPAGASNVVARMRITRECAGFDERLSHAADWDLWLRMAKTGTAAAVAVPLVAYA